MRLKFNESEIPLLAEYLIQRFEKKQESLKLAVDKLKSLAHDPDCKELSSHPSHSSRCSSRYGLGESVAWNVAMLGEGFVENLTDLKRIIKSDNYKTMLTLIDNVRVLDYTIGWFRNVFPINECHPISDYIYSLSREVTWIALGISSYICGHGDIDFFKKLISIENSLGGNNGDGFKT